MAKIHKLLAMAIQHRQAGRLQTAEEICRQIVHAKRNHADAIHLLGLIAFQMGKHGVAAVHFELAITLKDHVACFHHDLGDAYRALHRIPESIASYRRASDLDPENAGTHCKLGCALRDQGELEEAIACCRRALELKPRFAEAHDIFGAALRAQGNLDEAITCYRQAIDLKPDLAEAHLHLGVALKDRGELDEALALYRRALELNPEYAEAHCNLGITLEEMGDFRGAEISYRAALMHDYRFALAHYKLAGLLRRTLPESDLAAQRRLLTETELPDSQRLLLHFGLAQVLDARGEYAEAAEHLDRANALKRCEWRKCGLEYDPMAYEILVTQMIAVCTADFFNRTRGFGSESNVPVFVVGLPRSGTTLVEQILASHGQVFGAGETKLVADTMAALGGPGMDPVEGLRRLDRPTACHLASRHLEKLHPLNSSSVRVVDKMPDNYVYLGLLASLFPRARFIHCRRDLRDVAVSCWMTNFLEVRWTNDPTHIASRFREYERMMEHWRMVLPVPLLEVNYEETVGDPEGMARKLVAWCGLEWEPACLKCHESKRLVRTASAVQVRQPVYRTSTGRWRHYEHALESLFARIENPDRPWS